MTNAFMFAPAAVVIAMVSALATTLAPALWAIVLSAIANIWTAVLQVGTCVTKIVNVQLVELQELVNAVVIMLVQLRENVFVQMVPFTRLQNLVQTGAQRTVNAMVAAVQEMATVQEGGTLDTALGIVRIIAIFLVVEKRTD